MAASFSTDTHLFELRKFLANGGAETLALAKKNRLPAICLLCYLRKMQGYDTNACFTGNEKHPDAVLIARQSQLAGNRTIGDVCPNFISEAAMAETGEP